MLQPEHASHECRLGTHCRGAFRGIDDQLHGAFTERPGRLCPPCEERAFNDIRRLADDCNALAGTSIDPTGTAAPIVKVRHTPNRRAPISLDAHELLARVDDELVRWAVRLDPELDELPGNQQRRIQRCATAITARLGTLVDQPTWNFDTLLPHPDGGDELGTEQLDGVDAVLRLSSYHRRAIHLLGLFETVSYLNHELCPECRARKLVALINDDRIVCHGCGHTWSERSEHTTEAA